MDNKLQIITSFWASLFNDDNTKELIKGGIELGIDSIMQDGLLKDIPIARTLVAIGNLGINIRDRNLLHQTFVFIDTLNSHTIEPEKLNRYREEINNDPKKAEAELGRVIIILNSNIDDIKSKILAKCYISYINEIFDWNRFKELADIIQRIFVTDIDMFRSFKIKETYNTIDYPLYQINRLISVGLVLIPGVTHKDLNTGNKTFKISEVGQLFHDIAMQ